MGEMLNTEKKKKLTISFKPNIHKSENVESLSDNFKATYLNVYQADMTYILYIKIFHNHLITNIALKKRDCKN